AASADPAIWKPLEQRRVVERNDNLTLGADSRVGIQAALEVVSNTGRLRSIDVLVLEAAVGHDHGALGRVHYIRHRRLIADADMEGADARQDLVLVAQQPHGIRRALLKTIEYRLAGSRRVPPRRRRRD